MTKQKQNKTVREEIKIKDREKVKRFVLGVLGQYGRRWEDLTELQQATFEQDLDKLVSGIIYEVITQALQEERERVIEEIKQKLPKTIKTDMLDGSYGAGGNYELGRYDYRVLVESILNDL